jgi:hypothetical protein
MRAAVHDKHWEVRDSAASALCKLRDRRSLPVLVSHFENTASEEAFRAIIAFNDDSYIPNLVQVFLQLQAQGHLSKIRYMLADYFETLSVDRLMTITSETLVKMTKFRDYKVPEDHWVEGGPDVELKETRRKAFDVLSSRGAGPDLQPTDVVTGS